VALALLDRYLNIQRTDHAVLGGTDWQIDKTGAVPGYGQSFAALHSLSAVVTLPVRAMRMTAKGAISYYFNLWQQGSQSPGRCALCGPALASNQHTTDLWANRIQNQGHFHSFLAYYGGEGEYCGHALFYSKTIYLIR
jgi:hypothetical protein